MSQQSPLPCRFTSEQVRMIHAMTKPVIRFENNVLTVIDEGEGAPSVVKSDDYPVWFTIVAGIFMFVLLPLTCGVGIGLARVGYEVVTK